jgi:hypothetical protein
LKDIASLVLSAQHRQIVKVAGKRYHQSCFACFRCKTPLGAEVNIHNDMPCCDDCYADLNSQRCAGCGKLIMDACLKAMGKQWHPQCFVCANCKKPIQGGFEGKSHSHPLDFLFLVQSFHLTSHSTSRQTVPSRLLTWFTVQWSNFSDSQ